MCKNVCEEFCRQQSPGVLTISCLTVVLFRRDRSKNSKMFVNETMLILAYTANMMATLAQKEGSKAADDIFQNNTTTTTLSPEEKENQFNFADRE